ncbi:hypothetical protein KR054_006437 [Drosophila jambulina]|nr:hypothetical protein KR054_006437 [Drosophila jambulina]
MTPRKKTQPGQPEQPVRRSERLRLRKLAAEAAKAAAESEAAESQKRDALGELPRLRNGRSRALNGVATGSGITRRRRRSRRNLAATSTPIVEQASRVLLDRFMENIFQAARQSYTGEFSEEPTANLNQGEQPTESQQGWVSGQELNAEDGPLTEELDIILMMHSSESEMEGI